MRARTSRKRKKSLKIRYETTLPWKCQCMLTKCASMAAQRWTKRRRKRPEDVPGALRSMPGTSQELPWNVPSALRHPLGRSKGAPERLGGDLGRKMASLKSIFEAVADASWLFQAMFRFFVHRFSNAIELTRIVYMPTCYVFVVRMFCEEILFNLFLKAPRLNFRRLHVGSIFYTIFLIAILQVHLVYIYIYIYICLDRDLRPG